MDLEQIGKLYEELKEKAKMAFTLENKDKTISVECIFTKEGKDYKVEIYHDHQYGSSLYVSRAGFVMPTEFHGKAELLHHIADCSW